MPDNISFSPINDISDLVIREKKVPEGRISKSTLYTFICLYFVFNLTQTNLMKSSITSRSPSTSTWASSPLWKSGWCKKRRGWRMFRRSRHRSKHFLKPSPDVQWPFLSPPFYSSFEGKTNLYIVSNPDDIFLISSGSTQGARACQAGEDQVQVEQVKEEELDW